MDVRGWDISNVANMYSMFRACYELLKELDISNFNMTNVTDDAHMFEECESLVALDVSGFDVSNVADRTMMFYKCSSLVELRIEEWDLTNVPTTKMYGGTQWE